MLHIFLSSAHLKLPLTILHPGLAHPEELRLVLVQVLSLDVPQLCILPDLCVMEKIKMTKNLGKKETRLVVDRENPRSSDLESWTLDFFYGLGMTQGWTSNYHPDS